jgi:ABC-type sugar transport system substrate-binding protein
MDNLAGDNEVLQAIHQDQEPIQDLAVVKDQPVMGDLLQRLPQMVALVAQAIKAVPVAVAAVKLMQVILPQEVLTADL